MSPEQRRIWRRHLTLLKASSACPQACSWVREQVGQGVETPQALWVACPCPSWLLFWLQDHTKPVDRGSPAHRTRILLMLDIIQARLDTLTEYEKSEGTQWVEKARRWVRGSLNVVSAAEYIVALDTFCRHPQGNTIALRHAARILIDAYGASTGRSWTNTLVESMDFARQESLSPMAYRQLVCDLIRRHYPLVPEKGDVV